MSVDPKVREAPAWIRWANHPIWEHEMGFVFKAGSGYFYVRHEYDAGQGPLGPCQTLSMAKESVERGY